MSGTEVENVFSISTSLDSSLLKIQTWQSYSCVTKLRETVSMLMKSEMKIVFWFSYLRKTKIAKIPKISVRGRVKPEVARIKARWRSSGPQRDDTCLRRAVSRGNVTPTAIRSLPVPWPRSFQRNGRNVSFTVSMLLF